jgi:glycerol-3-phosphate dehydrogenase
MLRSLLQHYGTGLGDLLEGAADAPELLMPVADRSVIGAQAVHAVRNEMAQTLGDIVFRRTDLATGSYPGEAALRQMASLIAPMLGWDEARIQAEISAVQSRFPKRAVSTIDRDIRGDVAA